jgi:hypothetical protein
MGRSEKTAGKLQKNSKSKTAPLQKPQGCGTQVQRQEKTKFKGKRNPNSKRECARGSFVGKVSSPVIAHLSLIYGGTGRSAGDSRCGEDVS